ncbi:hypothetical protein BHE74_00023722, partial [Ensete ventricosum]
MADGKPKGQSGVWGTVKPFVNGGASGMLATCVIQPIDMVKVRIQLGQGSAVHITKNMLANEGFGSFYKNAKGPAVDWYADRSLSGGTAKIDRRRSIKGEIDRRRSIEEEKGKRKKKKKRKKRKKKKRKKGEEKIPRPRALAAREPSPSSSPVGDFSPHAGREIEAMSPRS